MAMSYLALGGYLFLSLLVIPHLDGKNDHYVYSRDNYIYRVHSDENHQITDLLPTGVL